MKQAFLFVIPSCYSGQALSFPSCVILSFPSCVILSFSSCVILSEAKDLKAGDVIATHRLLIFLRRLDSSLHFVLLRMTNRGNVFRPVLESFTTFEDRLREGMTD